jgi:hypothetical protein
LKQIQGLSFACNRLAIKIEEKSSRVIFSQKKTLNTVRQVKATAKANAIAVAALDEKTEAGLAKVLKIFTIKWNNKRSAANAKKVKAAEKNQYLK